MWPRRGGKDAERVTFLVNVWLNHKPLSAAPLRTAAVSKMGSGSSADASRVSGRHQVPKPLHRPTFSTRLHLPPRSSGGSSARMRSGPSRRSLTLTPNTNPNPLLTLTLTLALTPSRWPARRRRCSGSSRPSRSTPCGCLTPKSRCGPRQPRASRRSSPSPRALPPSSGPEAGRGSRSARKPAVEAR